MKPAKKANTQKNQPPARKLNPIPTEGPIWDVFQFFKFDHLPEELRAISSPFGSMAEQLIGNLPDCPELIVSLRKLLEAKDAAVRCLVQEVVKVQRDDKPEEGGDQDGSDEPTDEPGDQEDQGKPEVARIHLPGLS